ncbi:MAG: prolipoprotein diacylglyceryl transferase [Clostridia bacterium]|nr:prolipoprotein diacylglyceryl transferase [Clostridia bacterium]
MSIIAAAASKWPMEVRFPGLGISFDIDRVAFRIGSFEVYWYALLIMLGFVLAVTYAFKRSKYFGLDADSMTDVITVGLVSAVVCARAFYVIFRLENYDSFWEIINIRDGGIAIYGAVIGAFGSGLITCRLKKVDTLAMFDVAAVGFLIGQCLGRWGNFMNQEAFGSATSLPWGMESANTLAVVADSPVHPCFLYESIWCLIGFIGLDIVSRKCYKFKGQLLLMYVVWYGMGRVWIEGLRTDSLWLVPDVIRVSQLIAGLSILVIPVIVLAFMGKIKIFTPSEPELAKQKLKEQNA